MSYTVSFRVPLAKLAGQSIYLNGSAHSSKALPKGKKIVVREQSQTLPDDAEVIESVGTTRTPDTYVWTIE